MTSPYQTVLFVCVHNAGRSQMAEAFFNQLAVQHGLAWRAESAGTLGAGSLNRIAVELMAEAGVPMDGQVAKQLTPEQVHRADLIVSMGCGVDAEACPAKFLVTEDWGLDDPAGQPREVVARIRDDVRAKVHALIERLAR